jgi:tetratricopeptide (TPR) repeat protein
LIGTIYLKKGNYPKAQSYLEAAIDSSHRSYWLTMAFLSLSDLFIELGKTDSSLYYALQAYDSAGGPSFYQKVAALKAAKLFKSTGKSDSAVKYFEVAVALNDSLSNLNKIKQFYVENLNDQIHQQEIMAERKKYENQIKVYVLVTSIVVLFIIAFNLLRNNKRKQNQMLCFSKKQLAELQQQKTEVEMQALRAQMNPHFIFNSLNSINRFILQNNRLEASEYLTKFSKLVRMILQNSQAALITLRK